jgi:hypothetical protein
MNNSNEPVHRIPDPSGLFGASAAEQPLVPESRREAVTGGMIAIRPVTLKSIFAHILAAGAVASVLSAIVATILFPFFRAYFVESPSGYSDLVRRFDFGIARVDYLWMLAGFAVLFIFVPFGLGLWFAVNSPKTQLSRWYCIVGFGILFCIGVFFNLVVGTAYAFLHWNSD